MFHIALARHHSANNEIGLVREVEATLHKISQLIFQGYMDRIIGKGSKYLNTAVILLIADFNGYQEILFEKRHPDIPQGDEICFPGGRIDESIDTTPEEAAIREACEELGLPSDKIVVNTYLGTLIATLGVTVDAFVGKVTIDSWDDLRPNPAEVQTVFSIPVAWFQAHEPEQYHVKLEVYPFERDDKGHIQYLLPVSELGIPDKYHKSWSGGKLPIYVYRTDHGIIWGITAEIVREFVKLLLSEQTETVVSTLVHHDKNSAITAKKHGKLSIR